MPTTFTGTYRCNVNGCVLNFNKAIQFYFYYILFLRLDTEIVSLF